MALGSTIVIVAARARPRFEPHSAARRASIARNFPAFYAVCAHARGRGSLARTPWATIKHPRRVIISLDCHANMARSATAFGVAIDLLRVERERSTAGPPAFQSRSADHSVHHTRTSMAGAASVQRASTKPSRTTSWNPPCRTSGTIDLTGTRPTLNVFEIPSTALVNNHGLSFNVPSTSAGLWRAEGLRTSA